MYHNIVFIAGIHGAGKGVICSSICENTGFKYLSASELLRWTELSQAENKRVKDISITQERLILGLTQVVKPELKYVLDGHLCLLSGQDKIGKIDSKVFEIINPAIIVVVTNDVNEIFERLQKRDRKLYDVSLLESMQIMEVNYGKEISLKLQIPFLEISDGNPDSLISLIQNIM